MSVHDLFIKSLGPQGDGVHVGREGRCYVDRAVPGDRVLARVETDELGVPRGEILKMFEASPHRQTAPCPHYDVCGNCTLQHINEAYYRAWKTKVVPDALKRAGVTAGRVLDPIFLDDHNRRRATFAAVKERGRVTMGYYRRRTQLITDIDSCLVADPAIMALRDTLKSFLPRILCEGRVVDVFVQVVDGAADLVLTGPVGGEGVPDDNVYDTLEELMDSSIIVQASWRPAEGAELHELMEKDKLVATFGALRVELPPIAFLQPTPQGERALVDAVMAALPPEGRLADLFSGCGTFTGPMLARGPVDAYESVGAAVAALSRASGAANTLKVYRRDLIEEALTPDELAEYDAIVFDPPRGGCGHQASAMAEAGVPTLVGVSCNPQTFARDARILTESGYRLESVQTIDQFKWSHHVEIVGVFRR